MKNVTKFALALCLVSGAAQSAFAAQDLTTWNQSGVAVSFTGTTTASLFKITRKGCCAFRAPWFTAPEKPSGRSNSRTRSAVEMTGRGHLWKTGIAVAMGASRRFNNS